MGCIQCAPLLGGCHRRVLGGGPLLPPPPLYHILPVMQGIAGCSVDLRLPPRAYYPRRPWGGLPPAAAGGKGGACSKRAPPGRAGHKARQGGYYHTARHAGPLPCQIGGHGAGPGQGWPLATAVRRLRPCAGPGVSAIPHLRPGGARRPGGRLGGQQRPQGRLRWVPAYLAGVGTTAAPEGGAGGPRGQGSGAGRADFRARCTSGRPSP